LRINGEDGSLTCSLSGTTTLCSDLTHEDTWDVGDALNVRTSPSPATGTIGQCYISMLVQTPSGEEHGGIIGIGGSFAPAADDHFCGLQSSAVYCGVAGSQGPQAAAWTAPSATTLKALAFRMHFVTALPSGSSVTLTAHNLTQAVDTDLSCTINSGESQCVDTTCTSNCEIEAGDQILLRKNVSGNQSFYKVTATLEHDGPQLIGWRPSTIDNGAGDYYQNLYINPGAADAHAVYVMPEDATLRNLYGKAATAPGVTTTLTVCGSSSATPSCNGPTVEVTGTTLVSDTSTTLSLSRGDFFEIRHSKSSSGTSAGIGAYFEMASEAEE
jgi:hypothetical protein